MKTMKDRQNEQTKIEDLGASQDVHGGADAPRLSDKSGHTGFGLPQL